MPVDNLTPDGAAVTLAPPSGASVGTASSYTPVGYAGVPGQDEIAVLYAGSSASANGDLAVVGYNLLGGTVFAKALAASTAAGVLNPVISANAAAGGAIAVAYQAPTGGPYGEAYTNFNVLGADGHAISSGSVHLRDGYNSPINLSIFPWFSQFIMDWDAAKTAANSQSNQEQVQQAVFTDGPTTIGYSTETPLQINPTATAAASDGSNVALSDSLVQYSKFYRSQGTYLPDQPFHSTTSVAVVALADDRYAVAWAGSGTDYAAIYDPTTNSIGPVTGLDWGGADNVHLVSLGAGFAVSWDKGGLYKGEMFAADGSHGPVLSLAGDFAGVAGDGDAYTVGLTPGGQYVVQAYSTQAPGASGVTVHTSDADYRAPGGVATIYLTGSNQTVHANDTGDVIWSDNSQNTLFGGAGDDTFHLGRAGDIVTGGGGNDSFQLAEIPWSGGQILDFKAGDALDLTQLMGTTGDTGPNGFADGYLKLTDDGAGDAQVWARFGNVDTAADGSGAWWLVETLKDVSPSSLTTSGDVVTASSGSGGASGQTFTSDNNGDHWVGTAGDDTFNLGRGGDVVTGNGGADTFAFAETPWAGATITDFSNADILNVTGLLAKSGYAGSDPFADGYLKYTADSNGDAQLWSDMHQPGNDGWWLVATLDGVSTSSLHYSGGLIT